MSAIISKKNFVFIGVAPSIDKIVSRRWLLSRPGGRRPHAENGIKPVKK
jgi:hypothetical protein